MPANAAVTAPIKAAVQKRRRKKRRASAIFYTSKRLSASAETASKVHIDLKAENAAGRADILQEAAEAARKAVAAATSASIDYQEALHGAFVGLLEDQFREELAQVVSAYRRMLFDALATGDDPDLKAALNRARLQTLILSSTPMVDQAQACELMGLSASNPSATMKRKGDRGEILRFTVDGRVQYPLFQFDVGGRGLFAGMGRLMADKPPTWSDFRLLHWLTRPHLDFDGPPSARLGSDPEAVVDAFHREIAPVEHG